MDRIKEITARCEAAKKIKDSMLRVDLQTVKYWISGCDYLLSENERLTIDKAVHDSTAKQMAQKMLEVARLTAELEAYKQRSAALELALYRKCYACVDFVSGQGCQHGDRAVGCKLWQFNEARYSAEAKKHMEGE